MKRQSIFVAAVLGGLITLPVASPQLASIGRGVAHAQGANPVSAQEAAADYWGRVVGTTLTIEQGQAVSDAGIVRVSANKKSDQKYFESCATALDIPLDEFTARYKESLKHRLPEKSPEERKRLNKLPVGERAALALGERLGVVLDDNQVKAVAKAWDVKVEETSRAENDFYATTAQAIGIPTEELVKRLRAYQREQARKQ